MKNIILKNGDVVTEYNHAEQYFAEAYNSYIEPIALGLLNPIRTSIKSEMKLIRGFLPTDQIIIAARSGIGKTSRVIKLIDDIFNDELNGSYHGKIIVCYDSWEISGWRNAIKFMSLDERMTYSEILDWDNRLQQDKLNQLKNSIPKFKGKHFYISEFPNTVSQWANNKIELQRKFPEYLIVNIIDHARLITNENRLTEEALLHNFMKATIKQRKQTGQINIILSQMNRNIEYAADRKNIGNNLPMASDLFGSDSIFQSSDFVIALHRPGYYNLAEFSYDNYLYQTGYPDNDNLMLEVVLKNRNGESGIVFLEHLLKYNDFKDIDISKIRRENPNSLTSSFNTDNIKDKW